MGENTAFSRGVDVFHFHHPEFSPLQSVDTADRWLLS